MSTTHWKSAGEWLGLGSKGCGKKPSFFVFLMVFIGATMTTIFVKEFEQQKVETTTRRTTTKSEEEEDKIGNKDKKKKN